MNEITTRAEQLGADLAPTSIADPTFTLSQFQALLRDAAVYERAQRPIVLHGPETAVTTPHPGVNVAIPAAPVTVTTVKHSERSIWPLLWTASACTGIGSCLVTAVTGSLIPLAVTLAALAVWGVATYRLVFIREL